MDTVGSSPETRAGRGNNSANRLVSGPGNGSGSRSLVLLGIEISGEIENMSKRGQVL